MRSGMYMDQSPVMPAVTLGLGTGVFSYGVGAWWAAALGIGLGVAALVYWIASKAKRNG